MAGFLEGSLAESIYKGFKGKLLTGSIRQRVPAESSSLDEYGDPQAIVPTETPIEGFAENYDALYLARAGLPKDSVKVNFFAKSAPGVRPGKDDLVRLQQASVDTWYQLRRVKIDPAGALWECPDAFVISAPEPIE